MRSAFQCGSGRRLQKNMNAETCGTYYEHARILKDDKILDAASKSCSGNIMSLTKESRLLSMSLNLS